MACPTPPAGFAAENAENAERIDNRLSVSFDAWFINPPPGRRLLISRYICNPAAGTAALLIAPTLELSNTFSLTNGYLLLF